MTGVPLSARIAALRHQLRTKVNLYNASGLFNTLYDIELGRNRPVFYDIATTRPELLALDAVHTTIRAEYQALQAACGVLPPYHTIDTDVMSSSGRRDRDRFWRVFMLHCFGQETSLARQHCPETLARLHRIPGLMQAFFSVLEPRKNIPAHVGPSRIYLRYHLGLDVPTENTPVLRVSDQRRSWRTGESFLFDDSYDHEIINTCDRERVVLIVDIERPISAAYKPLNAFILALARNIYAPRVMGAQRRVLGLGPAD
jgi:aspartyl/asparaginyl beta-hydroxylase (cupin superfamily)